MQKMPTVHEVVDHAKTDAGCRTILLTDKEKKDIRSNHKIRKTTLSAWLDAGMNADKVCEMAGHEDIETTMKYYIRNRDNDDDIRLKMSANL